MTVRTSLETTATRIKAVSVNPPWYVRAIGGLFLVGTLAVYLLESALARPTPHTTMQLAWHGIFLVIGLTMFYPEGARFVMGFLRRTIPLLNRREGRRR